MPRKSHQGHREYYASMKPETIEVIEGWKLNFNLGNVIKYISRHNIKPGEDPLEALQKASWYLTREVERLQKEKSI